LLGRSEYIENEARLDPAPRGSAQRVLAGRSASASGLSEKCRAGLSAKAARASRCASSSLAQLANQVESMRKSAERSLRPLRRSLSAAIALSSCGMADLARARNKDDGSLEGKICLLNGDNIPFIARRSKTSSTAC
jgi:hypothetical protein